MSSPSQGSSSRAAVKPSSSKHRRRSANWVEQKKREAWGRFWGNANKGAMKR